MHQHLRVRLIASLLLLLAVACDPATPPVTELEEESEPAVASSDAPESESPSPTPSPTAAESEEPPPNDGVVAKQYFEAQATHQPTKMRKMLKLAAEGSPAEVYADVQIANVASQPGTEESYVEVTPKGVKVCPLGEQPQCIHHTDIIVDNGKIVSWSDKGSTLGSRISAPSSAGSALGTKAKLIGGFYSLQSDVLVVALEVQNRSGETLNVNSGSAEYVTKQGQQVGMMTFFGPTEVRDGAKAEVILVFSDVKLGGTAYLGISSRDFRREDELSVKLPPMGDV